MTKRIVEVFPDYCSTGLWLVNECDCHKLQEIRKEETFGDHVCVDPEEVGVSKGLQLALKYWHEIWEFNIADSGDDSTWTMKGRPSQAYVDRWVEDGRKLAALLSAESDQYEFIYKQSKY